MNCICNDNPGSIPNCGAWYDVGWREFLTMGAAYAHPNGRDFEIVISHAENPDRFLVIHEAKTSIEHVFSTY